MKRSAIFGAWLVATALAVGIGIGAVQLAGAQVNDDPIQPIAADEVPTQSSSPEATLAGSDPTGSTVAPTTSAPGEATVPGTPSTTIAGGSVAAPPTTSQAAPGTTAAPSTTVPETTSATSTTSTVPSTAPSTTIGAQVFVYQLVGGSVAIEASPGVVNYLWATPNAGFITEVESGGPSQVEVDFESGSHKSKFRAEWSGGVLDIEQREEAED